MRARDRLLLEAMYASWAAKDLKAVLSCCSDDIVFAIHVPPEMMPFAGETRGKAAIVPRLQMILDDFDFLEYRPTFISRRGRRCSTRRCATTSATRRRGTTSKARCGTCGSVEGDQIVRLEEFHDTPRVATFFELLAEAESGKPQREFPNIKRNK